MRGLGLVAVSLALVVALIGTVGYIVLSSGEAFKLTSNKLEPQPPSPAIPPRSSEQTLTEEEKSGAIKLALNDTEVKKWLGRGYEIYEVVPLEDKSSRMCIVYILTKEQKLPWVLGITIGVPVDLIPGEAQGGCINFELKLTPLAENQKEEVLRIALADPDVLEMIGDKEHEIQDVGVDYWESCSEGKCSFHAYPAVSINVNPDPRLAGIFANIYVDLESKEIVKINSIPKQPPPLPPSKENPYEIPLISSFRQINLYEDGEVESLNGLGGFAGVFVSTLSKLNLQATCVFSEEDIQNIKRNDEVIEAIFVKPRDITISQFVEPEERDHIPTDENGYMILKNVKIALFILEDNLDDGLEAHILVGKLILPKMGSDHDEEWISYSCWAINIKEEGKPELDKSWVEGMEKAISFTPFFPTQSHPATSYMEALLSDKTEELELMDGCLRVNNGYDNYLLVWPYGFSLSTKDGVIRVIDDTGQPIVRVGDKIKVSGGECAGCTSEDVAKISVQLPSERCSGPYWIVGAEINKEG